MAARVRILTNAPKEGLNATPASVQSQGASQTFTKGAVLINGSAGNLGTLVEGGADPTALVGIAEEAGANNAAAGAASIRFTPVLPHVSFEMTLDDGTGTYALVAGDKFKLYGIAKDGSGNWYIDQTDTSNTRVVIVGFKDPVGTQAARVYAKFRPSQTIYN
jgi:hypothetical protein